MPETVVFITEVIQFIFKANSFFTVNKKSFHFTGTRKTHGESELKNTEFQKIQEQYWHKLLEERRKSANNRRRFQGSVSFLPSNYSLLYMPNMMHLFICPGFYSTQQKWQQYVLNYR